MAKVLCNVHYVGESSETVAAALKVLATELSYRHASAKVRIVVRQTEHEGAAVTVIEAHG